MKVVNVALKSHVCPDWSAKARVTKGKEMETKGHRHLSQEVWL